MTDYRSSFDPINWKLLSAEFYLRNDVCAIARDLLGKYLIVHHGQFQNTQAKIVEVEAYNGIKDRASHAFGNRRTKRTETMYLNGACAYVYLCYGIHNLFNVVTNTEDIPHAILIRGVEILGDSSLKLGKGPGKLSKSMHIDRSMDAMPLNGKKIGIYTKKTDYEASPEIFCTPRIGVDYAGEDAMLPYRYFIKSKAVSGSSALNNSAILFKQNVD